MPGAIDERGQQIEGTWTQRDRRTSPDQASLVELELEWSEAVTGRRAGRRHWMGNSEVFYKNLLTAMGGAWRPRRPMREGSPAPSRRKDAPSASPGITKNFG